MAQDDAEQLTREAAAGRDAGQAVALGVAYGETVRDGIDGLLDGPLLRRVRDGICLDPGTPSSDTTGVALMQVPDVLPTGQVAARYWPRPPRPGEALPVFFADEGWVWIEPPMRTAIRWLYYQAAGLIARVPWPPDNWPPQPPAQATWAPSQIGIGSGGTYLLGGLTRMEREDIGTAVGTVTIHRYAADAQGRTGLGAERSPSVVHSGYVAYASSDLDDTVALTHLTTGSETLQFDHVTTQTTPVAAELWCDNLLGVKVFIRNLDGSVLIIDRQVPTPRSYNPMLQLVQSIDGGAGLSVMQEIPCMVNRLTYVTGNNHFSWPGQDVYDNPPPPT